MCAAIEMAKEKISPAMTCGVYSTWKALMMTQGVSKYTMTTDRLRLSSGRSSFALTMM